MSRINKSCKGYIDYNGNVCSLLYADELVLLSENENDLQNMFTILSTWCSRWGMKHNKNKSKIMHIQQMGGQYTDFNFSCGNTSLDKTDKYKHWVLFLMTF